MPLLLLAAVGARGRGCAVAAVKAEPRRGVQGSCREAGRSRTATLAAGWQLEAMHSKAARRVLLLLLLLLLLVVVVEVVVGC